MALRMTFFKKHIFSSSNLVIFRRLSNPRIGGVPSYYVSWKAFLESREFSDLELNVVSRMLYMHGEIANSILLKHMFIAWQWKPIKMRFEHIMRVLSSTAPWLGLEGVSAGESIYATALKAGVHVNLGFYDNLIYLYGRNGMCKEACVIYKSIEHKTVNSLNAYLEAVCLSGSSEEALTLYKECRNFSGNIRTFVTLMNCFSHFGLTDQGTELYKALKGNPKFVIPVKFYGAVIDLYSRAEMYDEAFKVVDEMDLEPNNVIWTTILAVATRNQRNDIVQRIERIVKDKMDTARDSGMIKLFAKHYQFMRLYEKSDHYWKLSRGGNRAGVSQLQGR